MTAKEKAKELVTKFSFFVLDINSFGDYDPITEQRMSKQCAKISVEELIKEQTMWQNGDPNPVLYWQDVLKEIEKL